MSFREPRPGSPGRLRLKRLAVEKNDEGGIEVVVRLSYYTYCCDGQHELTDAARAIERLLRPYDEDYDPSTNPEEELWHAENIAGHE